VILIKIGGVLHLPETGYKLDVKPSDVFFLANQQLHKLDVGPRIAEAEQLVFTLWTDKNAAQSSVPGNTKDFTMFRHAWKTPRSMIRIMNDVQRKATAGYEGKFQMIACKLLCGGAYGVLV
jgi:hypothetical protein